jgi:hypothetical protein
MPQVNATLQEMVDHHEIRKMLSVYAHGCDRADESRMASIYAEDSWDDHGLYKGPGRPYAEKVVTSMLTNNRKTTHLLGQSQIKVDGDRAGAETYFLAGICTQDESGQDLITLMSGRYIDTLVRVKGEWKVDKRTCVRDWSISLDLEKDTLSQKNFVQGLLSGADPSYAILGLNRG